MRKGNRGKARKEQRAEARHLREAFATGDQAVVNAALGRHAPVTQVFAPRVEKEPKQCRLPSCTRTTLHNGGYCCAQHAALHKEAA